MAQGSIITREVTRTAPLPVPADTAIGRLQRLRRVLAPKSSLRERVARLAYRPILALWSREWPYIPDDLPTSMIVQLVHFGACGAAPVQADRIRNITVLKLDHIGDFIVGLRALRSLRSGFPNARITLLCAGWNMPWAKSCGLVDDVIEFDFFTSLNRDWLATPDSLAALYEKIHLLALPPCDLAIDLRHDADTRPCLYRIDATYRAGFLAAPETGLPALDLALPQSEGLCAAGAPPYSLHAELRLQLLIDSVVAAFAPRAPHPALAWVPADAAVPERPFAVLAIGAGDPIRAWPIARYGEVALALIARDDLDIVILGGSAERDDAADLAALLPPGRVRQETGLPLVALPTLLAGATLCVCNGSGISHLSAALGVATICILGGTTRMEVWHPAGPRAVAIGGKTPCQPCGLRFAAECPWGVACLMMVEPRHVLAAWDELRGPRLSDQDMILVRAVDDSG